MKRMIFVGLSIIMAISFDGCSAGETTDEFSGTYAADSVDSLDIIHSGIMGIKYT